MSRSEAHSTVQYYHDGAGEWRWRVVDDNGQITGDSGEGYTSKANAEQGFRNVQDASE